MRPLDTLAAAAGGLAGNRLRSALTMLGIVIGVAAVITLVAVGRGASAQVTARLAGLGTNLVLVMPWRGTVLSTEDARELGERIPGVRTAMPVRTLSVTARHGTRTYETTATGVTQDYPSVRGHPVAAGRFLTAADVAGRRPVAVLGRTVADALFPSGTSGTLGAGPLGGGPLGETILLNGRPFRVVGVLQPKGATLGQNADDVVLIPVTVAQRLAGDTALSRIDLEAASPAEAPLVVDQALRILRLRHPRPDGQDPVRVTSQDELLAAVESSSRTFSLMLG
ncbi:MAG: ABC transporter permease, partial [Clostridia bacterium]|nr:ABC transporter permease [Clostridia bacterium]